jgi:HK97 gp10 family phage protein
MIKINVKKEWRGAEVKIKGNKAINKSIYEIGLIIEGQAKELAARNYGYMAASINTQSFRQGTELELPNKYSEKTAELYFLQEGAGKEPEGFRKIKSPMKENEVFVGLAVFYAPYVEFGTVRSNAQPFLRPALDMSRGKVLTLLWDGFKYYLGDYLLRGNK